MINNLWTCTELQEQDYRLCACLHYKEQKNMYRELYFRCVSVEDMPGQEQIYVRLQKIVLEPLLYLNQQAPNSELHAYSGQHGFMPGQKYKLTVDHGDV